jgi:hypothetical protein
MFLVNLAMSMILAQVVTTELYLELFHLYLSNRLSFGPDPFRPGERVE